MCCIARLIGIAHRTDHTIFHVDRSVGLDLTELTAAIHIAFHVGSNGVDVHLSFDNGGEQGQIGLGDTTAGAEDVAAIQGVGLDDFTDVAALDGHRTLRRIVIAWRRTDSGEGAAAIHVAVNGAALDQDMGLAGDGTGRVAVAVRTGNLVDTTTSAVHVAAIDPFRVIDLRVWCIAERHTDFALVDGDVGIDAHVAVLAAAKHRTPNTRPVDGIEMADGDVSLVGIAHEEVAAVLVARRLVVRREGDTLRGAEHKAVVHAVYSDAVGADGAARDGDVALAAFEHLHRIGRTCTFAVGEVVALTH